MAYIILPRLRQWFCLLKATTSQSASTHSVMLSPQLLFHYHQQNDRLKQPTNQPQTQMMWKLILQSLAKPIDCSIAHDFERTKLETKGMQLQQTDTETKWKNEVLACLLTRFARCLVYRLARDAWLLLFAYRTIFNPAPFLLLILAQILQRFTSTSSSDTCLALFRYVVVVSFLFYFGFSFRLFV